MCWVIQKQKPSQSLAHIRNHLRIVKITLSCPTVQFMRFSGPEYWSGQLLPSPVDLPNPEIEPRSPALQEDSLPAEPPGKPKNTGVGSLSLLQWIFLTQELNWGLLHHRRILYQWAMREAFEENNSECNVLNNPETKAVSNSGAHQKSPEENCSHFLMSLYFCKE